MDLTSINNQCKKMLAGYKRFEKYFFRIEKTGDRVNYKRLKYQFRMMMSLSMLGVAWAVLASLIHRKYIPTFVFFSMSCFIGFRFKLYFFLKVMTYIIFTVLPMRYYSGPLMFAAPATVMFANIQALIQGKTKFAIIHFVIQVLALQFYGIESIIVHINSMSQREIAENVRASMYLCIFGVLLNLITLTQFYSCLLSLLQKVSALKDNLTRANSQLNEQNLKLQNNLEVKDIFIYTFSHELKNALNGLLGNLTLAYDSAVNDSQVIYFLSSATVCGEVLKNFVHNILDSGKLENGNLEVSKEKKDVRNFMQKVWTICGRIIQNKRLDGFLEIEKNVPRYLDLDEQRMIQIILNLTSNAVKFTEKGYVRLRVSWETTTKAILPYSSPEKIISYAEGEIEAFDDTREFPSKENHSLISRSSHLSTERQKKFISNSHSYQLNLCKWQWNNGEELSSRLPEESKGILKIQVFDTGCGMEKEDQTKLFQKFSQANQAADQRKVGTGLGLWICKELANRLDGDIKVRSMIGVGSVFAFTVHTKVSHRREKPFNQPASSIYETTTDLMVPHNSKQRTTNTKKVLIADDDNFNIELMKNYLHKFEINYIVAYDGEEAVSLFKRHHSEICFVITDNFMPKKTGIEAALEIANFLEERKKPKIPIICISGDVKVHVGERGITSVIQKPINFDRLKQELMLIYPQVAVDR